MKLKKGQARQSFKSCAALPFACFSFTISENIHRVGSVDYLQVPGNFLKFLFSNVEWPALQVPFAFIRDSELQKITFQKCLVKILP